MRTKIRKLLAETLTQGTIVNGETMTFRSEICNGGVEAYRRSLQNFHRQFESDPLLLTRKEQL